MHNLTSLQNIKSHNDENSIPDGLIHVSQNTSVDVLINKIGKYIKEDFYGTVEDEKPKIHIDGENHSLTLHIDKYPHFGVLQLVQYVLAGKYTFFLHEPMKAKGIYWLLIVDNTTINDFVSTESVWFDATFTRFEGSFDGFAVLNVKRTSERIERSEDYGKKDVVYQEWARKNTLNGFKTGHFIAVGIFVIGMLTFAYVFFHKQTGTWNYKVRAWQNTFAVFTPSPEKIEATELEKYVGKLVDIPSGSFQMGQVGSNYATPVHGVNIKGFQMMEAEVTFDQWNTCVKDGACSPQTEENKNRGHDDYPVVNISYDQIVDEYLPWLYEKTGYKFELPSEAQWEFAAKGGSIESYVPPKCGEANFGYSYSRKYHGGDCGNKHGSPKNLTYAKENFKPNAFGLYNMHGNVAEIVADQYHQSYNQANSDGSPENNLGFGEVFTGGNSPKGVIRGGSFYNDKEGVHAASRDSQSPSSISDKVGFRLILTSVE